MLTAVKLEAQWALIEENLPADWEEVRLTLTAEQIGELDRAAAVLAPLGAGRAGDTLVLQIMRTGGGASPGAAQRLFRRLDEDRIWCSLQETAARTSDSTRAPTGDVGGEEHRKLAEQFDALLAELPQDWSDALFEIEPLSSAWLDRVALLCAPVNPTRSRESRSFLFRCAKRAGYGASAGMARRCLQRVDEEGITGEARLLQVLAETNPVGTQGPLFTIAGRVL
jgi:hypothetical protein